MIKSNRFKMIKLMLIYNTTELKYISPYITNKSSYEHKYKMIVLDKIYKVNNYK